MCHCDCSEYEFFFVLSYAAKNSVVCYVSLFVCKVGHETVVVD